MYAIALVAQFLVCFVIPDCELKRGVVCPPGVAQVAWAVKAPSRFGFALISAETTPYSIHPTLGQLKNPQVIIMVTIVKYT